MAQLTKLNIPDKIHVGCVKRDDTYTGMLAYVIYTDEKGKVRKEKSWNGWRDKKIPVKPPDVSFHRCGQDKIEPDNPGAALDDGVDDAGKLAGPHDLGDIAKRRAAVGFFVDGNDNDRRILGCMHRPKGFVPKPEQAIEG